MKKLLSIIVLGLLLSGNGYSNEKVEVLAKDTTVNDLLNEGYRLSSTNVLPPQDFGSSRLFYHLVKGKKLVTCVLRNGDEDEDEGRFVVFCVRP
jgi:hypothetical protein